MRHFTCALAFLFLSLVRESAVWAADDFYKGKTLTIISGTSAGSGTDAYARILQQFIGKHIPGTPTVVVENMPAGGGLAAINYMYNIARKDGLEIGLFNRSTLFARLLGDKNAKFEPERFIWIGTPASFSDDAWVFMINSRLPYRNLQDLLAASQPINVGKGSTSNPFIQLLERRIGVKMKDVNGYQNQELALAFERGEIDGIGNSYRSVVSTMPDLLQKHLARFVIQFGHADPLPDLADVPAARGLAKNENELALIELSELSLTLGFPIAAPPGTPIAETSILSRAFEETMNDPAYQQETKREKLAYSPTFAARLQQELVDLAHTPESVASSYKELFN